MKRLFIFAIFVVGVVSYYWMWRGAPAPSDRSVQERTSPQVKSETPLPYRQTLFVPYWQLDESVQISQDYDRYVYFGVEGTARGINTTDPGYQKLQLFIDSTPRSHWLAVRMTDSEVNDAVLASESSQRAIITDTIAIVRQYGFDGVVLDFEYSSLFGGKASSVTKFYQLFGSEMRSHSIIPSMTIYGDVFYRARPYDLRAIQPSVDEVMIMAYDLHKSRGEPGPNFPLSAGSRYGYGYDRLLSDLRSIVAPEKLTVIFGMYGYDWKVDEQKRPITVGESKTAAQIAKNILDGCESERCTVLHDAVSGETEVNYVDEDARLHIVWFESESSTQKKVVFLKKNNINSYAYWAYGYF